MRSDYSSVLLAGAVALVLAFGDTATAQQPQAQTGAAVLYTKNMCCAVESVPAIKEISKVPGVARVVADHQKRTLTIVPKGNAFPSPQSIFEAAQRAKLEVVQLSTTRGVYKADPRR